MKTYQCTDGFVSKTLSAASEQEAAAAYAIVPCEVTVTEVDAEGNEQGETTVISVA